MGDPSRSWSLNIRPATSRNCICSRYPALTLRYQTPGGRSGIGRPSGKKFMSWSPPPWSGTMSEVSIDLTSGFARARARKSSTRWRISAARG
jgi:hypothetical protein